jgi:hypothetical protein
VTPSARLERLSLGASSPQKVYAILDGARDERIYPAVLGCGMAFSCLYTGDLPKEMWETAPYLIHLQPDAPFTEELLRTGWGDSWGIFAAGTATLEELRRHFRRFLRVRDEAGKSLIFRWYDPRVMRVYLPTCNTEELKVVFGPVGLYWMEGEDPDDLMQYHRDGDTLGRTAVKLGSPRASGG